MFYGNDIHARQLEFLSEMLQKEGGIHQVLTNNDLFQKLRVRYEEKINSKDFMGIPPQKKLSSIGFLREIVKVRKINRRRIEELQEEIEELQIVS